MKYPLLFSPIQINLMVLKNRIVMTAMHLGYTPGGTVTERLVEFYALRAKGGAGLIIVGGNAVGLETALYLASQGTLSPEVLHFLMVNKAESPDTIEKLLNHGNKEVCVVEMTRKLGQDIGSSTRWTVMAELKRLGVKTITGAEAIEVAEDGLRIQKEARQELLPADSVVIAVGSKPENALASLNALVPERYIIGDAKKPRNALEAIREGFLTGIAI